MATIIVNGKSYLGDSIQIIVNGIVIKPDSKNINIEVNGDIKDLNIDICDICTINGNVGNVTSETGNVTINGNVAGDATTDTGDLSITGNVTGDVTTDTGDIICGSVGGNVKTDTGDVKCANVTGKVKTDMGDIKYIKKSESEQNIQQVCDLCYENLGYCDITKQVFQWLIDHNFTIHK